MTKPLSDRLTASRECDAEIAVASGWAANYRQHPYIRDVFIDDKAFGVLHDCPPYTTSLDAAVSLYLGKPAMIPSDPLECCRAALKQRGL